MNSRLCSARRSSSSRRQAGSTFRKVYLTKWRTGIGRLMIRGNRRNERFSRWGTEDPKMQRRGTKIQPMRIALVSPYSWTYPGGVTRHIEALARAVHGRGPSTSACSRRSTRRTAARARCTVAPGRSRSRAPDYLVSLGRTVGFKANGAVSNLSITPHGVATMHRELRTGGYDVVHIHEPVAPLTSWFATDLTPLPLVGTFHSYSDNRLSERHRQRDGAPPGAQPPARADRRLAGGRLDRSPLLRRPLPRHPQRRTRRRGSRCRRGRATDSATSCGSCSSARRSSARACRCCSARSRRCASTSRPS